MPLVFLGIGLAAGVSAGFFGIGGGLLIVPALVFFASFPTKLALGTSLGALLLPVGFMGAYTYYQHGNLNVRASLIIGFGIFFGAWLGARVAQSVPPLILQRMFAVFLGFMAIRLWMKAAGA
ncbi:MAG: TSUP family transporter [Gemmatimonadales bacterium]